MVDRGLSSPILDELAKQNIILAHLLYMGFSSPIYASDTRRDIPWNGDVYLGAGDWIRMPAIKESVSPAVDAVNIGISGVNQANIANALSLDYTNAPVSVYRVLLDSSYQMIDNPIEVFFGLVDKFTIAEDPGGGTSTVDWLVSSHWADFERIAGRRTNNADQQKWYPGDLGMEFAPKSIAELKWGSE